MLKLPVVKPKKLIAALRKLGFVEVRSKGSHFHLVKGNKLVTVPFHNRDLKIKTLKSIMHQAGITPEILKENL
jgi:predicted RNA binding protein YcfA (HicA-like mRNA interferase family)